MTETHERLREELSKGILTDNAGSVVSFLYVHVLI